jgi:hypothetical protein
MARLLDLLFYYFAPFQSEEGKQKVFHALNLNPPPCFFVVDMVVVVDSPLVLL